MSVLFKEVFGTSKIKVRDYSCVDERESLVVVVFWVGARPVQCFAFCSPHVQKVLRRQSPGRPMVAVGRWPSPSGKPSPSAQCGEASFHCATPAGVSPSSAVGYGPAGWSIPDGWEPQCCGATDFGQKGSSDVVALPAFK